MIYSKKTLDEKIKDEVHVDTDWYCIDKNGCIGIVASAGGMLPSSVVQQLNNPNNVIDYFRKLPTIADEIILENPVLDKLKTMDFNQQETYLKDLKFMTSKGLYYFDKRELNNYFDFEYFLKAKPANTLKVENLDVVYKAIILQTVIQIEFNIDKTFLVNQVS